jgi:hypothetical protein
MKTVIEPPTCTIEDESGSPARTAARLFVKTFKEPETMTLDEESGSPTLAAGIAGIYPPWLSFVV